MTSTKNTTAWAEVDEQGRLVLPAELVEKFGLLPGAKVRLDEGQNLVRLHRPVTQLTKVYIEPTVACNLDCVTCFRNAWEEPMGRMSEDTFESIYNHLKQMTPIPNVYFGGIGEPLFHPMVIDWIARIKQLGVRVEMITNGTILVERKARELIKAGLDMLWVSLDGATPETYADVRLGAELPKILNNLEVLARLRKKGHFPQPDIGIAFVAMKRNIHDLPKILDIGRRLGVKRYSVSNLQPATADLQSECLYSRTTRNIAYLQSPVLPSINLPKIDFDESTRDALFETFNSGMNINYAGNNWSGANDVCNFVESGTLSVSWTGDVSPCWPLMHGHMTYLHRKPRMIHPHIIGNVRQRSLLDLWMDPEYLAYRERLHNFVFAPCTFCGGCDLSEANQEDCLGNEFPACGGCLWAQGIIQCP